MHIQQKRAPFLTPFLKAVSFNLLVLMDAGLPIPELSTVEEDRIAMIGLENQHLELISIPQNKVGLVESHVCCQAGVKIKFNIHKTPGA